MSVQDRNATSQNTMSSSSPRNAVNCRENECDWVWNEIKAEARQMQSGGSEPFTMSPPWLVPVSSVFLTRYLNSDGITFPSIQVFSGLWNHSTSPILGDYTLHTMENGGNDTKLFQEKDLTNTVFEVMRKQEKDHLAELAAEKAHQEAIQAQLAIVTIDVGSPEAEVTKEFVAKEGDTVEPGKKVVMSKRLMKSIYSMKLRSEYKEAFLEKHGVKFGLMSGFVEVAVSGLQNQPIINVVLNVSRSNITDDGCDKFSSLINLESLNLDSCRIGDKGLVHLAELSDIAFGNNSLRHLSG
ncbi:unnamed protein product [Lactuca saligna]|uniref:Uncharacterized protein n=1 Tax=Lactuca saligna TaxID=75948 RepID=A0AA36E1Z0_LACSI|nr:unnamed protein product [Lactuca saligna]